MRLNPGRLNPVRRYREWRIEQEALRGAEYHLVLCVEDQTELMRRLRALELEPDARRALDACIRDWWRPIMERAIRERQEDRRGPHSRRRR